MKKTATGDSTENAFFPSKLSPLHLVYVGGVHRIHFPALFPQSTPRYIQLICATLERLHPPSLCPHTQQCQRRRSYAVEKRGGDLPKANSIRYPSLPPPQSSLQQRVWTRKTWVLLAFQPLSLLSLPPSIPHPLPIWSSCKSTEQGLFSRASMKTDPPDVAQNVEEGESGRRPSKGREGRRPRDRGKKKGG